MDLGLGLGGMGGLGGSMGAGMGGMPMGGGMDNIPPELQKSLEVLENMDERLGKLSVPLLKLQYKCGYHQCFDEAKSSWGSHDASRSKETLACLERCETPMQEFGQACETRLEGLVNKITACFSDGADYQRCIDNVLDDSSMKRIESDVSSDVQNIYQKYAS